jgi:hypothetical protein
MTRVIVKSDLHKLCGHTMKPLAWSVWLLIDPKWISMEQHGGCCLYVIQRTVDVWGHTYKSGRFSMGYGLQLFAIAIIGVLPLVPLGRLWGGSGGGGGIISSAHIKDSGWLRLYTIGWTGGGTGSTCPIPIGIDRPLFSGSYLHSSFEKLVRAAASDDEGYSSL